MSTLRRNYNRKKQNFNGLRIVHAEDVLDKKQVKIGIKIFGRLRYGSPYVTRYNPKTKNEKYIAYLSLLLLTLKNKIIDGLSENKKKKVHIII